MSPATARMHLRDHLTMMISSEGIIVKQLLIHTSQHQSHITDLTDTNLLPLQNLIHSVFTPPILLRNDQLASS